ncbi:MAG: ABC transporter permease [Burkholderiales bacterium]
MVVRYLPLLLIPLLWEAFVRVRIVSSLPTLVEIGHGFVRVAADGELWLHAGSSLYRSAIGLALAIGMGATLGIAMAWWQPVQRFMSPLVEMLYPLPKSALIPVAALWLGLGDGSKILVIFLACMLPVILGAYNGARGTDSFLIWSARSLGASRLRCLCDVVIPSALPELLNGIRTALAFSFIVLVTSELIVSSKGLGYLIGFLGDGGVYDAMFAVVLTVAAMGFAADRLYAVLARRLLRWRTA